VWTITKTLKVVVCLIAGWSLNVACATAATIVNFDNLDASSGDVVLGSYNGFIWGNLSAYTNTPGFPGYNNGIVSGPNAAYSGGQVFTTSVMPITGTISSSTPFDFISSYLAAGNYDNLNVTVEGLRNGTMLFTKTVTVSTSGAQLVDFGFDGINEIELFASATAATSDPYGCGPFNCTQFTVDNLTFAPYSATPEPSTSFLFGMGSASAFLLLRRRMIWARLTRSLPR
jgi:hypothetical protein